jgi:hypothetical protein
VLQIMKDGSRARRIAVARTGHAAQQTDEPHDAGPDDPFAPVAGDHGACGILDELAKATARVTAGAAMAVGGPGK